MGGTRVLVGTRKGAFVLTSDEGDEMVLATIGAHESIGELALIDGAPRSASVRPPASCAPSTSAEARRRC